MARIADLPLKYRLFLKAYRFRRLDPTPWTRLAKPLAQCRVALVTSAAFHLPDQEPFDEEIRGGDASFRVIDVNTAGADRLRELRSSHRSAAFDSAGIEADYNLALPVDRFRELEAAGEVGALHDEALSFMGSVTATGRLRRDSAPQAAGMLSDAGVDVAFLCPV